MSEISQQPEPGVVNAEFQNNDEICIFDGDGQEGANVAIAEIIRQQMEAAYAGYTFKCVILTDAEVARIHLSIPLLDPESRRPDYALDVREVGIGQSISVARLIEGCAAEMHQLGEREQIGMCGGHSGSGILSDKEIRIALVKALEAENPDGE